MTEKMKIYEAKMPLITKQEDYDEELNLKAELKKKYKIIDLMAKEIDDCEECPHEIYEEDFDCENCENHSSIECWKKYFERKV